MRCPLPAHALTFGVGQSQFLTKPLDMKPLNLGSLSLNDNGFTEDGPAKGHPDSDARLIEMLEAQGRHRSTDGLDDDQAIANDKEMPDQKKKELLQKAMHIAASNGDVEKVQRLLSGVAKQYVDVDTPDEDGTPPLIYASCFVRLPSTLNRGERERRVLTDRIGTRACRAGIS